MKIHFAFPLEIKVPKTIKCEDDFKSSTSASPHQCSNQSGHSETLMLLSDVNELDGDAGFISQ